MRSWEGDFGEQTSEKGYDLRGALLGKAFRQRGPGEWRQGGVVGAEPGAAGGETQEGALGTDCEGFG